MSVSQSSKSSSDTSKNQNLNSRIEVEEVCIRFAGDSGDGMQLTGDQFTLTSAIAGSDISTLPDYPAEIRAPAGSLAGVSGFQLNFSSREIHTPGDQLDSLVVMNPAALKVNLDDLKEDGIIILDKDSFTERNYAKAGYTSDPLQDGSLSRYRVYSVPLTTLCTAELDSISMPVKIKQRSKNVFALGILYWLYDRPLDPTITWLDRKFGKKPEVAESNIIALKGGYAFGETSEMFQTTFKVRKVDLEKGTYRKLMGNEGLVLGFLTASQLCGRDLFLGSYPITPASDILHGLSQHKEYAVRTFQAEDEISAIGAAIGASFGGHLAITTTSGPGIALKGEAMGLAVITELPLVIINVQRGGPSTGLPTKTEQADLFQVLFGRNGESPMPVIAAQSPADCFQAAIEASRIAIDYMTPVVLLSDGYIANGSEPWKIPDSKTFETFGAKTDPSPESFLPYSRDEKTLARPWMVPGTPGFEHRIGGLEKEDGTGEVSYDPDNHEKMIRIRAEKVMRVQQIIPPTEVFGKDQGDVLVLGWGGTYGSIRTAVEKMQTEGKKVSHVHVRYVNPLPKDLGDILIHFKHVLIPELNLGQFRMLIRQNYLVDAVGLNKIKGKPFKVSEITDAIEALLTKGDK